MWGRGGFWPKLKFWSMGGEQFKEKSRKPPERTSFQIMTFPLRNDLITIGNIFASRVETGCESRTTPVGHKASLLVHSSWGLAGKALNRIFFIIR